MPKNKFIEKDGKSILEVKCDFPGCNNYAIIDYILAITKLIWGGSAQLTIHTFSCEDHRAAVEEIRSLFW